MTILAGCIWFGLAASIFWPFKKRLASFAIVLLLAYIAVQGFGNI